MGFGVWGLGFGVRVQDLGLGLRIWGLGLGYQQVEVIAEVGAEIVRLYLD